VEATDEAAFEAGAGEVNLRPVMMKLVLLKRSDGWG